MKYPALSYGVTHRYPRVWPVLGRSGLTQDYPEMFRTAYRLVRAVHPVVVHPRWWRSRKIFSHATVVWQMGWSVNVYVVGRSRRRRRRFSFRLRRALRRVTALPRWWRRPPFLVESVITPGLWHRLVGAARQRRDYLVRAGAIWWATEMTHQMGHPVRWRWIQLRRSHQGGAATFLAVLRYTLRGRGIRGVAGVVRPLLRVLRRSTRVGGASIRCSGRFSRKQRADYKVTRWGHLARSWVGHPTDQARWTLPLKFGAISITLTVNLGRKV